MGEIVDKDFIAVDMGASGTKMISGKISKKRGKSMLEFSEMGRFPSFSYEKDGVIYWDILRIVENIKKIVGDAGSSSAASIGIDSWGVDFGLLNGKNDMTADPVNYMSMFRLRNEIEGDIDKYREKIESSIPTKFFPFNSIYQLMLYKRKFPNVLEKSECMLSIPSLVTRLLSGSNHEKNLCEFTQATTTQIYDYRNMKWDKNLLETIGIHDILPEVTHSGTIAGKIRNSDIDIVLPASHDTASAFAAVPFKGPDTMILSLGSWCINGIILDKIEDTDAVMKHGLSVEGCADGRLRCLSTTTGLMLFESLKRFWQEKYGLDKSAAEFVSMAESSRQFAGFIDVDNEIYKKTENIEMEIRRSIKSKDSGKEYSFGEMVRIILEGIAFKIRKTKVMLENAFGLDLERIHAVGGGTRNRLLCRIISDVTGLPVSTGPYEGSGIGNIIVQMKALNYISDFEEAYEIIRNSVEMRNYFPDNSKETEYAKREFENLFL